MRLLVETWLLVEMRLLIETRLLVFPRREALGREDVLASACSGTFVASLLIEGISHG